ncbi:MAG: hypothetical protein R3F14_14045 [Polyangiaceae bacterium]
MGRALALLEPRGRAFRNVLAVHRVGPEARERGVLPAASDVDIGLADNELSWQEIAQAPAVSALLSGSIAYQRIASAYRIGVRRVSLALSSPRAITVYYALREVEEP